MHIGSSFQEALGELRVVVIAKTGINQQCVANTISSGRQPSVLVHSGQYLCSWSFTLVGLGTEPAKLPLGHFFFFLLPRISHFDSLRTQTFTQLYLPAAQRACAERSGGTQKNKKIKKETHAYLIVMSSQSGSVAKQMHTLKNTDRDQRVPSGLRLIEFDSSLSSAIERIAVNPYANELLIQWRTSPKIWVYKELPFSAYETLKTAGFDFSIGRFALEVKKLGHAAVMSRFPESMDMFQPAHSTEVSSRRRAAGGKKQITATGASAAKHDNTVLVRDQRIARSSAPKVGNKKRRFKDRTAQWNEILSRLGEIEIEQLRYSLIPLLEKLHLCYPPSALPKFAASPADGDDSEQIACGGAARPTNFFNALDLSDSESDGDCESESNDSEDDNDNETAFSAPGASSVRPIQSRYFLVKLQCALAEKVRAAAVAAQKRRDFKICRDLWIEAYEVANAIFSTVMTWTLEIEFAVEGARYAHDLRSAQELVNAVPVLAEDTDREKDLAIQLLETSKRRLYAKLNPLLRDREKAKESMGDAWKENPAPKMTFAEKRRQMEEDMLDVSHCLATLSALRIET